MNAQIHKTLHRLEEQLIDTNLRLKILNKLCVADELQSCAMDAVQEKMSALEADFYSLWEQIVSQNKSSSTVKSEL